MFELSNRDAYYFSDTSFGLLMQKRIQKVLVLCSNYDFFTLEEDGRIDEQIFNEYVSLNLRYPPVFLHADSSIKALKILEREEIDLIIPMLSMVDTDTFVFAKKLKELYPEKPIVVLTHFSREVSLRLQKVDLSSIDHVFCWLGNTDIFLAIIKLIEDKMNANNDILEVGVQAVLLVEDSVRYISSYLPSLYHIILEQSKEFMLEALNEHQQMLRRRGRPKILLARNYDEAFGLYQKFKGNILGIISDVSYKYTPNRRDTKQKAGLKLCAVVKADDPNMPFLLQSSDNQNKELAEKLHAGFINKYSDNLLSELKEYIINNFGFGPFLFTDPQTGEKTHQARDLKEFQEIILSVPDHIIEYHSRRDDFSKWLNARALYPIARKFKEAQFDEFASPESLRKYIYTTISSFRVSKARGIIAEFDRSKFDAYLFFSRIGNGNLGGKARGLAFMNSVIKNEKIFSKYPDVIITIPATVVLTTDIFEEFMLQNNLQAIAQSNASDEEILEHFIQASLPDKIHEDLITIASLTNTPLAIRSSSKLEDSFYQPFAGIYSTYMIPYIPDIKQMVDMIEKAIKSVYASVYFRTSKSYMSATSNLIDEEKMGVIIQSVCGTNYGGRYYPTISGVARSLNYYPIPPEKAEDGVVDLAFGLGKHIVEGNTSLRFSPAHPRRIIQLSNPDYAIKNTQKYFCSLDMNPASFVTSVVDNINILKLSIREAEKDSALAHVVSTYDFENNSIRDGLHADGKKIITFSNILNHNSFPLAEIITDLLKISKEAMSNDVEIEFAVNLDTPPGEPKIFNYLQVRPIVSSVSEFSSACVETDMKDSLLYSEKAMGNGIIKEITDIVYVKTEKFNPAHNKQIATELDTLNQKFREADENYVLIGPGRWGSSDHWLGIPVKWAQISSARIIVESGLEHFRVDPSQGTHFFHNLTSFGVGYFTINPYLSDGHCNFQYLDQLPAEFETEFIRHVRIPSGFEIRIDGKTNKGIITV
ncbi:MAG: phosphoenolpyruvate synthase [Bacteroidota bacterium]|nr:MAG: phosphoenolpyruvate synthase [Bacteroidota bacterium]